MDKILVKKKKKHEACGGLLITSHLRKFIQRYHDDVTNRLSSFTEWEGVEPMYRTSKIKHDNTCDCYESKQMYKFTVP